MSGAVLAIARTSRDPLLRRSLMSELILLHDALQTLVMQQACQPSEGLRRVQSIRSRPQDQHPNPADPAQGHPVD